MKVYDTGCKTKHYHTREDCPGLRRGNGYREIELSKIPNREKCGVCETDVSIRTDDRDSLETKNWIPVDELDDCPYTDCLNGKLVKRGLKAARACNVCGRRPVFAPTRPLP